MEVRSIKPSLTVCPIPCDFSHVWTPVENHCTWSLMVSYSCSIFSWGKRPLLYDFFLYFQERLAHIVHDSSKTGLINGWEVLIGPTVDASKTMELLIIFVVFDQSSPPASPNYRKNSVRSRKLVLWIHISFVGQWSSCMWHNFCWHIACSLFLFFHVRKRLFPFKSQVVKAGGGFSVTLGKSFQHCQLQFPLLQVFQLQCSAILWLCGCSTLLTSHSTDLFIWQREGLPKFPLHSLLWISCWRMEVVKLIISGLAGSPLHSDCSAL